MALLDPTQAQEVKGTLRAEFEPRLDLEPHQGGFDCCGCNSPRDLLDALLDRLTDLLTEET